MDFRVLEDLVLLRKSTADEDEAGCGSWSNFFSTAEGGLGKKAIQS